MARGSPRDAKGPRPRAGRGRPPTDRTAPSGPLGRGSKPPAAGRARPLPRARPLGGGPSSGGRGARPSSARSSARTLSSSSRGGPPQASHSGLGAQNRKNRPRSGSAGLAAGSQRSSRSPGLGGDQVEGRQAVRELLAARRREVHHVLLAEGRDESPILTEIARLAKSQGIPLRLVGPLQIAAAARTDAPQGVIAVAAPLSPCTIADLLEHGAGPDRRLEGPLPAPFLLVVDGVTDPHNLGALLRTASCAGVTGVILARHRAVQLSPVVAKAAAGAIEHLRIALAAGIPGALVELGSAGVWSIGLDSGGDQSIFSLPVADAPLALVVGAEGRGLGALTRRRCDVLAAIPTLGALDSLNVSTAAAIACFEVARRRGLDDGAPPGNGSLLGPASSPQ